MKKTNCWEFMNCDRGPDGSDTIENGTCQAASNTSLDGIHGGINGGRICWVVEGCTCFNNEFSSFVQKYVKCMECNFYKTVRDEEGSEFKVAPVSLYIKRDMPDPK
ncbi:MAG: hypothetical protein JSV21_07495 [Nitrospirota bacterium]|nr:MAG: hypothetical protein JSV21_07495 [Nitrospirota bacterium]